jgi:transcriptional regulator with XRE-family HTH domain
MRVAPAACGARDIELGVGLVEGLWFSVAGLRNAPMNDHDDRRDVVQLILGFNLSEKRDRLGLEIEKAAEAAGIGADALRAFEAGERRPDAKTLAALANVLDVSPQEFFSIPKTLDAASRARLGPARFGSGAPAAGAGMEVLRAFARMRNLAGRDVVSDLAEVVSRRDHGR